MVERMIKVITVGQEDVCLMHEEEAKKGISLKQNRKRISAGDDAFRKALNGMEGETIQVSGIKEWDILYINAKVNFGTKKWPDIRDLAVKVCVEKVCSNIFKCYGAGNDYRVDPSRILCVVRG